MLVGMDIGYSALKLVYSGRHEPRQELVLPVGVASAETMGTNFISSAPMGAASVLVDGEVYITGVEPEMLPGAGRILSNEYASTTTYRALFHTALLATGANRIARIVTGLPVSLFLNRQVRDQLTHMLSGQHQVAEGREVVVESARVVPQPLGAFLAYADAYYETAEFVSDKTVLIVDPGFFSVDSVVLRNNQPYPGAATSSTHAMSNVIEHVDVWITKKFGDPMGSGGLYANRIEQALREGKETIYVAGSTVEIIPYVEQAAAIEAERAATVILRKLRNVEADIDVVLLAGGGAEFYAPTLRKHFKRQRIVVVEDAPMANAHGFRSLARAHNHG